MSALCERVRAVLGDEYDIEHELGIGGMGVVFLGRERALDRPVAIKILRPDQATATAAERFHREARLLASVNHPNIVTIHRVGEKAGLFFFVMERLEGTLADRLRAGGPIPPETATRLGVALLGGLGQLHDQGMVHRDIKPGNVFLHEGRAKLGDFGIARSPESAEAKLTQTGHSPGTPAYMAPEQFVTGEVTPAADLYSMGMVLYEMVTGRRWSGLGEVEQAARWQGVPMRLAHVLQRALALEPHRRWSDAGAFAAALKATRRSPRAPVAVGATVVLGVAAVLAAVFRPWRPAAGVAESEVAVLPFRVDGAAGDAGEAIALAVQSHLQMAFPDSGIAVTPSGIASQWWARQPDTVVSAAAWSALRTRRIVKGSATSRGDSLELSVVLADRSGVEHPLTRFTARRDDWMTIGYEVGRRVVGAIRPDLASRYRGFPAGQTPATNALIEGDLLFEHDNWLGAESLYVRALALDSSLAQASWRLYNVRRWRKVPTGVDLAAVYARHGGAFADVDALLIEADLAKTVPERLAIYRRCIELHGYDAYPWLMLGNELFHRGALAGVPLDSAVVAFDSAVVRSPYLAPTYSMLAWAWIRLGREAEARAALSEYKTYAGPMAEAEFCLGCVLDLAWLARFDPERASQSIGPLAAGPGGAASLFKALRVGLAFGVPETQLGIARQLEGQAPDGATRAHALVAQATAALALGRVDDALRLLELAHAVAGMPDLALQRSQWMVVLPALGVPGVPAERRAQARSDLLRWAARPEGARARWALALDAAALGDPRAAEEYALGLDGYDARGVLSGIARGWVFAAHGDTTGALRATDSLALHVQAPEIRDPLERVVLFLSRGRWLAGRDDRAADIAWRWYENADQEGWPAGAPQAVELDWALEAFARYLRADLADRRGDRGSVCALARDAAERWRSADSAYAPLRRRLRQWAAACAVAS